MSAMSTRRTTTTTAMTVIVWSLGEVEELVAVVVRSVPVVARLAVGFEAKVSVVIVVGSGMCGMKEMKMYTIYLHNLHSHNYHHYYCAQVELNCTWYAQIIVLTSGWSYSHCNQFRRTTQ